MVILNVKAVLHDVQLDFSTLLGLCAPTSCVVQGSPILLCFSLGFIPGVFGLGLFGLSLTETP